VTRLVRGVDKREYQGVGRIHDVLESSSADVWSREMVCQYSHSNLKNKIDDQ
jgi:hypothetical protein